ncbi:hypothetical protein BKP45_08060 [Anaerobacillus alkalidiazotrophicus]|uniref:Uncharacterized protein n=1 Tax=Anaerobacillus alkalidiazotrophicus TaxID=472963 RepID=A0A1S2M7Y4_9BACI|nr:hypothetical protein [Anaerobacillus alkalidiazotrophicus]OIJ20744.1 hypothetical protein BKP45_08060 [Anaerobacillus alkalidiazotrophicus]
MRQTYYGVSSTVYQQLEKDINLYSQLTRNSFNRALDKTQKQALLVEKEALKKAIQQQLSNSGMILGFLNSEQIEAVETEIENINSEEIKGMLRSNFIPYLQLEALIVSLSTIRETTALTNLIFFLERAKQNEQSIIVWIM